MTSVLIFVEEFIMLGDESGWHRIASSDGFSFFVLKLKSFYSGLSYLCRA